MTDHYDKHGYFIGSTDEKGWHYDKNGYFIGSTDDKGDHYDKQGYYTGHSDSDGGGSGSGGCFLTTAMCEYLGKPDDCEELTVLRSLRDGYMMKDPIMATCIEDYYSFAPIM